jgi:tRNA (adenine22-N1)-methyltransferase
LLTVASLIRESDRVLDIGTDHARLPVYLTERGLCASVTATDISPGPLSRASRTIRAHRLENKIALLMLNGAEGLDPDDYDTVTVTGMGGDTILSILGACPWLYEKRLIAQPQTRISRFAEMAERRPSRRLTVCEGRREYTIFIWEDAN